MQILAIVKILRYHSYNIITNVNCSFLFMHVSWDLCKCNTWVKLCPQAARDTKDPPALLIKVKSKLKSAAVKKVYSAWASLHFLSFFFFLVMMSAAVTVVRPFLHRLPWSRVRLKKLSSCSCLQWCQALTCCSLASSTCAPGWRIMTHPAFEFMSPSSGEKQNCETTLSIRL